MDSEQAIEKSKFDRTQATEVEVRKLTAEKKRDRTRETWGFASFVVLIVMNFVLLIMAVLFGLRAYNQTDIASLFKETNQTKWSFSRIIGFAGGCFTFFLFLFVFDMSLAHLFFLGTMPDQFGIYAGTVGTLLVSQLPYIVNKMTGKE